MSTLSNFPALPASVGGQKIPDFLRFKVVGDGKLPARLPVKPEFDFSIKKSPVFGSDSGLLFDEGARWHPLREAHFAFSNGALSSYQGHYIGRTTALAGAPSNGSTASIKLRDGEYITGFKVYVQNDFVSGLKIWTSEKQEKSFGTTPVDGSDPSASTFEVPKEHEIVNFYGYTNADGRIHGFGASYNRRLASLAAKAPTSLSNEEPRIDPIYTQTYLDASTQQSWANNDMETIEQKKNQAAEDLKPIYQNIVDNGENAWVHVQDPDSGEEYYLSWTESSTMWSYVTEVPSANANADTKDVIISIGSYSLNSNFLGVSGYIWKNIPALTVPLAVGLAVAIMMQSMLEEGITWGISFAAQQLAEFLAAAGVEELALLVPASVAFYGGLVVAGVIGMIVAFGIILLMNVIWKKYWLTINVYNFDPDHEWNSMAHVDDNSNVTQGTWVAKSITRFVPADNTVHPPGFVPQKALDNVVTYLSICFENDSTFLQGLGEGILIGRDDGSIGTALKYVVHRLKDNEIGVQGIDKDPSAFDLGDYYYNWSWVQASSTNSTVGNIDITGYTPALSGADGDAYVYNVNIGLPPPVAN